MSFDFQFCKLTNHLNDPYIYLGPILCTTFMDLGLVVILTNFSGQSTKRRRVETIFHNDPNVTFVPIVYCVFGPLTFFFFFFGFVLFCFFCFFTMFDQTRWKYFAQEAFYNLFTQAFQNTNWLVCRWFYRLIRLYVTVLLFASKWIMNSYQNLALNIAIIIPLRKGIIFIWKCSLFEISYHLISSSEI